MPIVQLQLGGDKSYLLFPSAIYSLRKRASACFTLYHKVHFQTLSPSDAAKSESPIIPLDSRDPHFTLITFNIHSTFGALEGGPFETKPPLVNLNSAVFEW